MAGLAMGLGAWGLAPPPASAGVVDDLFEQVGVLDSLSYRFVSSYDAGGGKLIERSHDAIANVPGLLDVDDKLGPDVTATLSSIDGKNATLTITTIGGKKLPLAMQTLLPDPGVRSMYFGYDARAGAAPSTFTAKLSLLSEEHVRIDATTAGAQPGVFAVNGGTFRPVGKKRVDPVIVSATFDKTPAKAKIDAELGAKKRFTLTSGGGTAALVRAELATGEALDRIEALVPVLPTWVQVQYDADEPAGSRHVVYDASSKTADVAFAYSQFLAGIERQRMDIRFADVPQKADVVQDQTHVRLFTSTPLARVDVALRQAAGLMQIGGKTVRSLTARADELPTDLTVDYQGGTKGYRVKPKTGRLDLVELRLSSLLDPQPVPAGLGGRAWGDGRHLPGPGDIASPPASRQQTPGSRLTAPAPAPAGGMPGLRGPGGLTAGPSRDGLVYVRDLKDSFDLYARISELRSASIVLDPLPDVQVDSAASRPLTLDARTEAAGKAPRILTGKLSPLPAKVRVRVHDTGGERRFGYTAGGTVDSLLLTGSGIPLLGRATAFQVKASGVPAGAEVRFAKDGVITGTMTAPVGDLTLRALDKAGTLVALPDAQSDGVVYENRHGRFAAMVRIRDLTSFRISPDAKHAAVAVDSLSKHPFTADVRLDLHPGLNLGGHANTQNSKPDRAVSARIDKLSRHMSLGLSDLGPAKGSRIDYAADTPIKDVRVTADGYRLAPKGDYAALRLQDVPTQLSVVVDPVGTVTATSPGEPIGMVEVMLTDGPGTTIMPPAAQDGVRYSDTKKGWGVGARVSRLQSVAVGTKPGAIVHVDSLAAKPFEADLTFADGDRVTGAISALARNTRVSLTPTATGQRADYSADGPIASLRLVGYGIFDLPRGPQVLLEAKDIPSKLRVDLGAAGSVAGTAPDGVGSIQVIATDDVGKPYAPWGEPLLQNEHGFMLHDVPKERYFLGVRVFGLRSFELPATESIVVKADADKRPLTADLRMPFAEPQAGETTPAEPLVNNSGIPYEYYRMRLEQTQPHTRITLDLADRGAESVSNVTYEADAAGPGFGMTSNAGGHQLTTTSVTPMPKQLHACISSYRWCSTSDGFIIKKNLGGQPDGPFKGQIPNIGGAIMLAASSPVTLDFIDCWKSAGSCVKKPGLDADYDGVQLRGFTFQKVALDMSGIKYDTAAISNGLKGHLWVDTDEYPASGTFVMRDPGGDVESINITLPAKFRTQDRLAVFKADRPVLEDVAENSYWGDGGVDCDTGIGLDGWFASEQAIQVYRKALCHYGHPPVPK